LAKKLGVKPGSVLALLAAPRGLADVIEGMPDGASVVSRARGACDVIVLFCRSAAEMKKRFPAASKALAERGGLWLAWPKKASGVETDLSGDIVRAFGLKSGLVDNKVCAIDTTWSGLRFARRRV